MIDQTTSKLPGDPAEQREERRTNALWISWLTAIALAVIAIISYRVTVQTDSHNFISVYLAGAFSLIALIAAILSHARLSYIGSSILILSALLATLLLPYLAAGQVTAPAIASLLVISAMAAVTLPGAWSFRVGFVSIITSIGVIVADLFLPESFGIRSRQIAAVPLSVVLAAVYAYFILRRFNYYTLRFKLLIAFILVTIIPLAILGFYNNAAARNNLRAQGNIQLENLAKLTATQVDAYIGSELDSIRIEAQQPVLVAYLELNPFLRRGSPEESGAAQTLSAFIRKDPIFIESYALLDAGGTNVLDTADENIGKREGQAEYFTKVMETGEIYVSNAVLFRDETPDIFFSAPVRDQDGQIVGVLRAEYNAGILQSIVHSLLPADNTAQTLGIVDQTNYLQIAFSGDRNELYKSYRTLAEDKLHLLQSQQILPAGKPSDVLAPSDDMVAGLESITRQPFFTAYSRSLKDSAVVTAAPLRNIQWVIVASQSEKALFAPIRQQTRGIVLLSLTLIIVAALSSLLASRVLMSPITALTQVAERISTGYLTARAQASTRDEIGTLATAFNNMTFQLRQALTRLEERVQERTADLEKARQQSDKRAQGLQAISDVARAISSEQRLETLLPLVTQLVSDKFGFYHTGIFLTDVTHQFAVLRAANSEGGQHMLERGHRLEVGQTGIVGFVAQTGKPRIALDVGSDAVFFNNPDLPDTRSEMALPLTVRGQTIGVLDVQSTRSGAFSEEDINTLSIMADQIAIAIENARLFGQTHEALDEVQALYKQYLRQEWDAFARQENRIGYYQGLAGGKVVEQPIESEAIHQALETGGMLVMDSEEYNQQPSITIPLKLRGETIGVLSVASPRNSRQWSQDEINLVQAVSERLALALENSRLLQDSLRRAAKEQKIGQVTAKIGASMNMRTMLQTAVEELGHAIPGSDVVIQFQHNGNGADHNRNTK